VGAVEHLVEFPLDLGGSVLVEVDEPPACPVTRGLGKDRSALEEEADKTFEDATAAVAPAARSPIARLRSIDDVPDEIAIQFGVQLSVQTGAFIASRRCPSQLRGVDDLAPYDRNLNNQLCRTF
jgi:hypothetical protein